MATEEDKPTELTHEQRRAATQMVIGMIVMHCGQEAADYWAWERTPMPCGLPLDEQLLEGLKMAARGASPEADVQYGTPMPVQPK